VDDEVDRPVEQLPWWRDRVKRTRASVWAFALLALAGILFPAFTNYLLAGDRRVLVVNLQQNAGQPAREALREACGGLPGVRNVADRGNPDPRIQGRFPVRFDIADITSPQYSALTGCVDRQPGVLGYLTKNE
jgi:hypothetical protein